MEVKDNSEIYLDFNKIGQHIRTARIKSGMTQAELAELLGCSNNHVSHIELGQMKPSLTMLSKIAHSLKQNMSYFLSDTFTLYEDTPIYSEINDKVQFLDMKRLGTLNKIIDALLEEQNDTRTD